MIENESTSEAGPKGRRSKRRVVVIVMIAWMVGWVGWMSYGAYQHGAARRLLEDRGYRLITEEYGYGWYRDLAKAYPLPKLERVVEFLNMTEEEVHFMYKGVMQKGSRVEHPEMSREELEALGHLRELTSISIRSLIIEDPDLYRVTQWPHLRGLILSGGPVTDECLRDISSLVDLRILNLNNANITDEGLKHLVGMPLEYLLIRSNKLTDASLPHLATLTDLERLALIETQVTPEKAKGLLPWVKSLLVVDDFEGGKSSLTISVNSGPPKIQQAPKSGWGALKPQEEPKR